MANANDSSAALLKSAEHWQAVYTAKQTDQVSWYRPHLDGSLSAILRNAPKSARIIDVGAGASTLVDDLLAAGYTDLTVLDVAQAALDVTRARLGQRANEVRFLCADLFEAPLDEGAYDVWHDRAVFHFLTRPEERGRYVQRAQRALRKHGVLLLWTFAKDGPTRCSGLDVEQHDEESVRSCFEPAFLLRQSGRENHQTPSGSTQHFAWFELERM